MRQPAITIGCAFVVIANTAAQPPSDQDLAIKTVLQTFITANERADSMADRPSPRVEFAGQRVNRRRSG